ERAPARDLAPRRIERRGRGGRNLLHLSCLRASPAAYRKSLAKPGTLASCHGKPQATMPDSARILGKAAFDICSVAAFVKCALCRQPQGPTFAATDNPCSAGLLATPHPRSY